MAYPVPTNINNERDEYKLFENEIEVSGGELTWFSCSRRAKRDDKIGGARTCEVIIVVSVAISVWARLVESLRVDRPGAVSLCFDIFVIDVESDTAKLWQLILLTRGHAAKWIVRSGVAIIQP